jgi:hypothetical protein
MNSEWNIHNGRPQPDHVAEVVRSAETELRQLLRQRAEVMKRIGTIKQTLAGLANLFGDNILSDELLTLVEGRSAGERQRGFTRACRSVLIEADAPLKTKEVCEHLGRKFPEVLQNHSNAMASVSTVLGRLEGYAEVRSSLDNSGHRVWRWIADRASPPAVRREGVLVIPAALSG